MLLADFDPGVSAIAAQPFLLRERAGGQLRRHVPDFLLVRADHTVQVVNVKPAARLADPAVAEALAWPGPLFEARGWDHEIWTGASPVLLANVRFLAGYRRPGIPPDDITSAVLGEARPGERLGGLLDRLERAWPRPVAKAAVLRLLWTVMPRRLQDHGLVQRGTDPRSRSIVTVEHTASGRRLIDAVLSHRHGASTGRRPRHGR